MQRMTCSWEIKPSSTVTAVAALEVGADLDVMDLFSGGVEAPALAQLLAGADRNMPRLFFFAFLEKERECDISTSLS